MQGSNNQDLIANLSKEAELRRSNFLSQTEAVRKKRGLDNSISRRLVSASTYLHPNKHTQIQLISPKRTIKHATDVPPPSSKDSSSKDILNSNRPLTSRSRLQSDSVQKTAHEDFNSHLVQLKMEEMTFKFKSRIGTLLKEIGISVSDLTRFTSLAKIDDILNFLSQKVKERMVSSEIIENNVTKIRSKQRELLADHEGQIQSMKKKLQQKQAQQRILKTKIKETHAEMRDLYDKLNLKQKQLSNKMTELYQSRTIIKENQKLIETLNTKTAQLQKERTQLRQTLENSNKDVSNTHRATEEQNQQLKTQIQEMKQALEMAIEKEARLIESNKNMSEQVARWRERFQEERDKSDRDSSHHQQTANSRNNDSSAAKNYSQQENCKLIIRNQQLQSQIKQLQKEIKDLSSYKEKYQSSNNNKEKNDSNDTLKLQKIKQNQKDLQKLQMQRYYIKKMQENSTQWRDKLICIVDQYSAEEEALRWQISKLQQQKKQLDKKVFHLANEKYLADCKVIQKDAQIYHLTRNHKNSKSKEEMVIIDVLLASSPGQQRKESIKFGDKPKLESLFNSQDLLKASKESYSVELYPNAAL